MTDSSFPRLWGWLVALTVAMLTLAPVSATAQMCSSTVTANVVALDQVFFYNRLGTVAPGGMIFALERDVVPTPADPLTGCTGTLPLQAGCVELRPGKRPRPMILRVNAGSCLQIHFTNLLDPVRRDAEQPATRTAGINVVGLQAVTSIADNGENVGANGPAGSGLVAPGGSTVYSLFAEREGQHLLYSPAATTGGEGNGGSLAFGLFGAVHVEPPGAIWYRSQVTAADVAAGQIGTTPQGHPILDYDATFADGTPVFKILSATGEIVHSDLTAIIAGPNGGRFPTGTYPPNPIYPDRDQPFREFTIIYHDEIAAVQAFPIFLDPQFQFTLHSVRDGFAFNYGTGGIGAEIVANRVGVGPMKDCVGCKYEEFFLTSWVVGDPAMVVDVPANASDTAAGIVATAALFPDDPSNVYHSYLRDHVKFRIVHAGPKEHHIHHQHTHQWVFQPDSDESAYLDSQALGPGAGFTLEMTYNSSGNRNAAVGDSIFHCHFYPHFAQGMWAMWRVHDVFEDGTRMLPDGEIAQGSPIPGLVPLPGLTMAPMPGALVSIAPDPLLPGRGGQVQINGKFLRQMTAADIAGTGNPGYPFWVPGVAGSRPPHPPLDTVDDGGLPRHVLLEGEAVHVETRLDFTKEIEAAEALAIPETGHPVEQVAMAAHEVRFHDSFKTDGTPATGSAGFIYNGLPRQPGAPYADPCMLEGAGRTAVVPTDLFQRTYKAANIQLDVVFNKSGWHFPQQRIITLWEDVQPTFDGLRPPEPFFFRANTNDCITYYHTNLVPNIYELDDFQVRTPTDILGQHIHLVKFDVLASDGAANGWNYEDGTFSPDEVRERIHAINARGGLNGTLLAAQPHPFFGSGPGGQFLGAQTTVQRWYADDVLNLQGEDRTLRTVFTHDHYGPSTHQQAGLYAGLVVEPKDSTWRDPESGVIFGSRADGGPTSWRADILTADPADSYREFMLEYADFQLAYQVGGGFTPAGGPGTGPVFPLPWGIENPDGTITATPRQPGEGFDDPPTAVNPPGKVEVGLPFLLARPVVCPISGALPPCPEAISADDPGTFVVNYRNEPIPLRVRDPNTNTQALGDAGDLSLAYSSPMVRVDPVLNQAPALWPYGPLTGGLQVGDPFTPLLRAYENDNVQIRTLVGAHEEGHNFAIHALKWLFEPSEVNSGWRASQMAGISEHFEFKAPVSPAKSAAGPFADHLYMAGAAVDDQWNGNWGILRAYRSSQTDLLALPSNPAGGPAFGNAADFTGVCPRTAPSRLFDLTAIPASAIPGGTVVYNSRTATAGGFTGPLHDPTAIVYVHTADLDRQGNLLPGVPVEPIILRANAGDCIELILRNNLPAQAADLDGFNTLPMIVDNFNTNQVRPSARVGLHAQLVALDPTIDDGAAVGFNNINNLTPPQGNIKDRYRWYAGDLRFDAVTGNLVATPVEFGAINLTSSDRIKHGNKGAIGALIVEPEGAAWTLDPGTRASATVSLPDLSSFREFVVLFQTDLNLRDAANQPITNTFDAEDPEDSGQKAINYKTEPVWFRMGFDPDLPGILTRDFDFTDLLTNALVGGDPETPVFTATVGDAVRFRVLDPAGHARNSVFAVHGHVWQQEPYINGSSQIGDNPESLWEGSRMGHGPMNHFNAVLEHGAGGAFQVPGDYLYRDQASFQFSGGIWGLLRVDAAPAPAASQAPTPDSGK